MFIDRKDAGKKLALKLEKYKDNDVIAQDTIKNTVINGILQYQEK